jgi:3'-5' exoribonuclease
MRKVFIKDLRVSDVLLNHKLAVKEIAKKKGKTGNEYLNIVFSDKTGQINAKAWSNAFADIDQSLSAGDVANVTARVDEFNGKPQIIVEKMSKADNFDPSDFLQKGERDADKIWQEIINEVNNLQDEEIKNLILNIFSDESFVKKYKEVPAAELVHQDYVGGLVEHNYEMMVAGKACKDLYKEVRWAELLYGVLFHDVGKVEELNTTGIVLERTKGGYLLGHLVQGLLFLNSKFPSDFDKDKKERLLHMIASHNGSTELGSPIAPMTLEAILLSALDDLSFKAGTYYTHLRKNEPNEKGIAGYNRYLGASILSHDS